MFQKRFMNRFKIILAETGVAVETLRFGYHLSSRSAARSHAAFQFSETFVSIHGEWLLAKNLLRLVASAIDLTLRGDCSGKQLPVRS